MFGDARLGTLDWVEWVTITNGALDYTFPLVKNTIQRQPMFSFPQSTQQGPIDRPSIDPRLSYVSLLNDLTGGLGYAHVAPTDDLTRYFWGSLETRFKGYTTLPQQVQAVSGSLGALSGNSLVVAKGIDVPGGAFPGHRYIYFYDHTGRASVGAYVDATPGIPLGAVTTLPIQPRWMLGMSNVIVAIAALAQSIYTSVDGATFTVRENTKSWSGLVEFDNKVWSFNGNDLMLYAAVDPTQGLFVAPSTNPNGWRAMTDVLQLYPREVVQDLVVWRDNQGQQALYIVTTHRLVGVDSESGELITYSPHRVTGRINGTLVDPRPVVWQRDRQLYLIFPFAADEWERGVRQYTGTESAVGPTHGGQLPVTYFGRAVHIDANAHNVLVWHNDGQSPIVRQGVLAYNEQGGWHPVFTSSQTTYEIRGGGYDGGNLYVAYANGAIEYCALPDSSTPSILVYSKGQATSGSITLAETECGAPGVYKLGAYLYVDARKPDNSSGLPANNTLQISGLTVDGAAYTNGIPYSLTSAATLPAIVPLTTNGIVPPAQDGLAFRRLQLALSLSKTATTDDSARLVDVGLYYDLWREQRYAYQFAVDFTDDAWGYPRSTMGGLDRGAAISTLLGLQDTRRRFKVTFGGSGDRQVVVQAAEILIASRADDNQRGIFPVTIRDVSAPASG